MEISELLAQIREGPVTIERFTDAYGAISKANTDLSVYKYQVDQLRKGLEFYKPGPFWEEVVPSKAAEDKGKHAEWILRLTDPDPV